MNPTHNDLERTARHLATTLGHRPWVRHIHYFHNWNAFVAAAHVTRAHTPQLRGLAARGRTHRNRCIWTDANLDPAQHDETLTHELAHAMLPWRHGHTTTWLRLHIDLLATTPTRQLINPIAAAAATQHGLDWPPQPNPPTRKVPMPTAAIATALAPIAATSVADDLTVVVTRPDGTTHSHQSTLICRAGGDRIATHRSSLARWYGVTPDAVGHIQNTTYTIDHTEPDHRCARCSPTPKAHAPSRWVAMCPLGLVTAGLVVWAVRDIGLVLSGTLDKPTIGRFFVEVGIAYTMTLVLSLWWLASRTEPR